MKEYVIKHLEEDKATWEKIALIAQREAKSDAELIKKLLV